MRVEQWTYLKGATVVAVNYEEEGLTGVGVEVARMNAGGKSGVS